MWLVLQANTITVVFTDLEAGTTYTYEITVEDGVEVVGTITGSFTTTSCKTANCMFIPSTQIFLKLIITHHDS